MQIKDILGISKAKLIYGKELDYLNNFSKDTRTIKKNDTYLGLKGEVYDGSTFYKEAIKNGAKTCILSNIEIDKEFINKYDCNIIIVTDVLEFLKEIAKIKRASLNIPIIAVTGSVGKTTTKNMIAKALETKYKVLKTKGNLNTVIGLCLTILSITDEEVLVLEMGMNKFGEISTLTNIAKPTIGVITNIGTAHIGNLGSRENILKAKLEILEGLKGPIIINNDNDLLNKWQKDNYDKYQIITYGIDNKSDYQATNITYNDLGSSFKLNNDTILLNVLGKHFIYNTLVAYAICDIFKIEHELLKDVFNNLELEEHRMNLVKKNNYLIIDDTYNASYDSVYYDLEILKSFKERKIVVLGDILELGEYGPEIHQNIGKLINKANTDILITIGPLSNYINEEAVKNDFNKDNSYHFKSNDEAIKCINNIKEENDVILLKASHSMNFLEILNNI